MTAKLDSLMLIVAGIIHVLPLAGVLGPERLAALYGLDFSEPNLAILMRHRAVVIGLLGVFLLYAACRPSQQPVAFVAGLISAAAFLGLAWATGGYNSLMAKVVAADVVALACLIIGAATYVLTGTGARS
jgi:uncharacterized BrkB/YihY/UPF0761 family membrane protein